MRPSRFFDPVWHLVPLIVALGCVAGWASLTAFGAPPPTTLVPTSLPRAAFPDGVYGLYYDGIWRIAGTERHRWYARPDGRHYFMPLIALGSDGALWTVSDDVDGRATIEHFTPPSAVPQVSVLPPFPEKFSLDSKATALVPRGDSVVCAQRGRVSVVSNGTVEQAWTRDAIVKATGLPSEETFIVDAASDADGDTVVLLSSERNGILDGTTALVRLNARGIVLLDRKDVGSWQPGDGLPPNRWASIESCPDGRMFATSGIGLFRVNGKHLEPYAHSTLDADFKRSKSREGTSDLSLNALICGVGGHLFVVDARDDSGIVLDAKGASVGRIARVSQAHPRINHVDGSGRYWELAEWSRHGHYRNDELSLQAPGGPLVRALADSIRDPSNPANAQPDPEQFVVVGAPPLPGEHYSPVERPPEAQIDATAMADRHAAAMCACRDIACARQVKEAFDGGRFGLGLRISPPADPWAVLETMQRAEACAEKLGLKP